jgi:DNA-binding response OmpR family regulator
MAAAKACTEPESAGAATLLIVEDNVVVRLTFADHLRENGFAVIEASSASEALDVLQTEDISVALVFSDIAMPGQMDGFGLLKWIRANRPGLPVLLTSAIAERKETLSKSFAHEPFVDKPYDYDEALARIRAMIDAAKQ